MTITMHYASAAMNARDSAQWMFNMEKGILRRFFEDTDETGRFMVVSNITGVKYFVEPIGDGRGGNWGSVVPGEKDLAHKKGDGKYTGSVTASESVITSENGFKKVVTLAPGESPLGEIALRDEEYERQGVRRSA